MQEGPSIQQEPNIAQVAALIGDATRAKMLIALMGGKALTATELAIEAEITAQTASSHLSKLVSSSLVTVQKQGRHKYFQLAGRNVAELLENLLNISSSIEHSTVVTGPPDTDLRKSRICYDHLAGELGVQLLDTLQNNGHLTQQHDALELSASGLSFFENLGTNVQKLTQKRRPLCKNCLDWSERRHHLAGSLGQWILEDILKQGWASKDLDTRTIRFSTSGLNKFHKTYQVNKTDP